MNKVLILGGSGFLGSHLLNQLSAEGIQARVLSRNPTCYGALRAATDCEWRAADVHDVDQLAGHLAGCDALINLIGILNERGSNGAGFHRAHVAVMETAIKACRRAGVSRLLQISAINAGHPDATSHYLRSKGEAEQRLRESDLDWTILRPSVIFGPGDSFLNRFALFLHLGLVWLPLACPQARMQPVFVGDVVRAMTHCLADPGTIGQTYELGGPRTYSLIDLVRYTRDQLGIRRWVAGLPAALSRIQAMFLGLVPGKPFSTDNYRSLQVDNVVSEDGLAQLGLKATALEAVAPRYLGNQARAARYQRFRRLAGR